MTRARRVSYNRGSDAARRESEWPIPTEPKGRHKEAHVYHFRGRSKNGGKTGSALEAPQTPAVPMRNGTRRDAIALRETAVFT